MQSRTWYFTHSDSSGGSSRLATILGDTKPVPFNKNLDFKIVTPGTLVLRSVNDSYDGTYEFELGVLGQKDDTSAVRVFIASKVLSSDNHIMRLSHWNEK